LAARLARQCKALVETSVVAKGGSGDAVLWWALSLAVCLVR
jgi:hypothetical protein